MSFNIDALGLPEKPTEKVTTKLTKTRKDEVNALVELTQQRQPDVTEDEILEKLIGLGLDALKPKGSASRQQGGAKGSKGDKSGLSTSSTAVED